MTADISTAIRETTELFRTRGTAEDWSNNIIEGSRSVKSDQEWTNYYAWLASPSTYDSKRDYKAQKQTPYVQPELPKGMKETVYVNGTERFVHVTRVEEDEKEEKTQE